MRIAQMIASLLAMNIDSNTMSDRMMSERAGQGRRSFSGSGGAHKRRAARRFASAYGRRLKCGR